jgi:hypothetical protein
MRHDSSKLLQPSGLGTPPWSMSLRIARAAQVTRLDQLVRAAFNATDKPIILRASAVDHFAADIVELPGLDESSAARCELPAEQLRESQANLVRVLALVHVHE